MDESTIDVPDDTKLHFCKCGKSFLTRQGLYKHIRRAKDYENHRKDP